MSAARFRRIHDRQFGTMLYRKVQEEIGCMWVVFGGAR